MPTRPNTATLPSLVRIKPGALDRLGVYLSRAGLSPAAVLVSRGLEPSLTARAAESLRSAGVAAAVTAEIDDASFETATRLFAGLPPGTRAVVGLGGGKALDTAKFVASLGRLPYFAVPTSLSNDGFCSPQSSLTVGGKRRSLPAAMPAGVVVDTAVCLAAPLPLWRSGVGDLVAKVTAVADWKLAFHAAGTPVDDLAALLSDATVFQFMARPVRDEEGVRLLATALMLNGIAMEIAGSSRPASGSEHLVSHALDALSARPRLHGVQVGAATYLVSRLQGRGGTPRIAAVLEAVGFWEGVRADPFPLDEWRRAVALAPTLRPGYHTVPSEAGGDRWPEIAAMIESDPVLRGCFTP
jgi:glycerol-1-phosphate dehydrogenase [NAD(P)+]